MFCTVCGQHNQDDARFCTACGREIRVPGASPQDTGGIEEPPYSDASYQSPHYGAVPSHPQSPEEIPNYLPQAILVTICCCLPAGIVSIVYAAQVNGKVAQGDVEGARQSSNNARTWAWVAFGLGILVGISSAAINL